VRGDTRRAQNGPVGSRERTAPSEDSVDACFPSSVIESRNRPDPCSKWGATALLKPSSSDRVSPVWSPGFVLGHSGNKRLPSPATNTASITIRPRPVHLLVTASQPANDLAAILDDGDVALGVLDNTYSPTLVEFYGELGVDFVWLDFEHGGPDPWDGGQLEDLLRAGERTDVELLVRLPDTDPTLVRKALDLGARNVFLPRVETAEEVRDAVRSARFRYDDGPGDRGLASPRASRWGSPTSTSPPKTGRPSSA